MRKNSAIVSSFNFLIFQNAFHILFFYFFLTFSLSAIFNFSMCIFIIFWLSICTMNALSRNNSQNLARFQQFGATTDLLKQFSLQSSQRWLWYSPYFPHTFTYLQLISLPEKSNTIAKNLRRSPIQSNPIQSNPIQSLLNFKDYIGRTILCALISCKILLLNLNN